MHVIAHIPPNLGYLAVFLLILGESAGLPLPGETSLTTASVLAAQGELTLPLVILVAACGAILGDNLGYHAGRTAGRWLLTRDGRARRQREQFLRRGEVFFARHGPKTVFAARWLPILRFTAGPLAGAKRMPWRRFLLWNAVGGASWATTVGTAAYLLGTQVRDATQAIALIGAITVILAVVAHLVWRRIQPTPQTDP